MARDSGTDTRATVHHTRRNALSAAHTELGGTEGDGYRLGADGDGDIGGARQPGVAARPEHRRLQDAPPQRHSRAKLARSSYAGLLPKGRKNP